MPGIIMFREIILEVADDDRIEKLKQSEEDKFKEPPSLDERRAMNLHRDNVKKIAENLRENNCKMLNIADNDYNIVKAKLFIKFMKELSNEIRGGQIYVDKDGMPVKHTKAKASLRKLG